MSVVSKKRLLAELKNKKYRDAYAAEHVKTMIPIQTRILREQRGLSQGELAERMKTTQSVVSRHEDPNYGKLSLSSALKIASAFDVALLVKFVPFSRLLQEFADVSPQALSANEFTEDLAQLEAWAAEDSDLPVLDSRAHLTLVTGEDDDLYVEATVWDIFDDDIPLGKNFSNQQREEALSRASGGTQSGARLIVAQDDNSAYARLLSA